MKNHRNEEIIAKDERTLQHYHFMSKRRNDSRLEDSRRSVDIPSLQLQFPTGTYNPTDSYVSQPSTGMDEDDEVDDEFTYRHQRVHDSRLQDSRRSVDIPPLQLQFPTGTYNPVDSYVSQPSAGMDENDEANDEFTSRQRHV
ncbi:hypothetical protein Scep_024368 [Stephania cephalantha]|uniref:Uncharacterized protein n=1 Tax=Stephania cephalantha TaxID=152367 RepID=A0AAP0F1W3_9MAGN